MKIVLVNAKFSANLGEGVIAECLEYGLKLRLPGVEVINCDLAGRTSFGAGTNALRRAAQAVLPLTPDILKKSVYARLYVALVRGRLLPHYDKSVNGADIAIVGGGQLFADSDLNFPMKIAAAASIIRERNLPIAIHAVGVSGEWSPEGADLFDEAFAGADIIWASVRDELSRRRWRRHFGDIDVPAPRISMDPGMLAAKTYATTTGAAETGRNRRLVGLCISHPTDLLAQSDVNGADQLAPDVQFYRETIKAIAANDCDILLFTNGATEDEAYLHRCVSSAFLAGLVETQVTIAPQSRTPAELVATIRQCDAIAAHRLHACIIAYAFKIPHVGISLNSKLDALFDTVGRRDFVLGSNKIAPADIADALRRAFEMPISENAHTLIINRVERDFDELAADIAKAYRR